jgi:hypothetical protein
MILFKASVGDGLMFKKRICYIHHFFNNKCERNCAMKRMVLILIVVFGLCTCLEAGEVYEWFDKNGVKKFSDEPPPPGVVLVDETKEITTPEAVEKKGAEEASEASEMPETPEDEVQAPESSTTQAVPDASSDYGEIGGNGIADPPRRRSERELRHHKVRKNRRDDTDNFDEKPDMDAPHSKTGTGKADSQD